MKKRVANLISTILNPFSVSPVIFTLLSFHSASGILEALKWALISTALGMFPVFSGIIYLVRNGKLDTVFTSVRRQRTKIYLLCGLCAGVGYIILNYLQAPPMLEAAFVTGLCVTTIFLCINLWWKISVHTALVAASATVLIILYGWLAAVTLVLLPLTAWARIELKHHSLAQVAAGALLAPLITVGVFYPFVLA